MWKAIEFMATTFNLVSNAVMTYKTCIFPDKPVPITVIFLQILANSCWMLYSYAITDVYLFTTAGVSFSLQILSFNSLLLKNKMNIKLSTSDDELRQFPAMK